MKKVVLSATSLLLLSGCTAQSSGPQIEFSQIQLSETGAVALAQPSASATPDKTASSSAPTEPEATESSTPQETESASPAESEEPEYAQDRYAEIDIDDQSGDGRAVRISEIHIAGANSFLVIYNDNGVVLGSALVTTQSQPVTLLLDQPLEQSQELEAALYRDDGDGVFNLQLDKPIIDDDREIVHEDFYYSLSGSDD